MDPASVAPSLGERLLDQGVLGIVVIILILAVVMLWRKIAERDATIAALQESRVQFSQSIIEKQVTALTNTNTALTGQTGAIKELDETLRSWIMESQARRGR